MNALYSQEFCALDLETTGVNPYRERIIEIGIIRFNPGNTHRTEYHSLVNPEHPVSGQAYAVHGISEDELADKPVYGDIAADVRSFIGDSCLVIQNPMFDLSFLQMEHRRIGFETLTHYSFDTVLLARQAFPALINHKLDTVSSHLNIVRNFHRALDDALCCADIFVSALHTLDPDKKMELPQLKQICGFDTRNRIFRRIKKSMHRGVSLHPGIRYTIRYMDKGGSVTERQIIPRNIYRTGAQTILHAYCFLREEDRYFNMKRIQHIVSC